MIPRLHRRGQSFKGSCTYILHDPEKSKSSDRVAWSETRNLASSAEDAWFEMFLTHRDQALLKAAAGVDARGRKNDQPVLHFSLSWAPDEAPDDQHMRATAHSALKALGLEEHQALIAAHTDKKHRHVHVVVNTVHPLTGRTADLKFSKIEFSRWAEAYEKENGFHCEQRVVNNADRDAMRKVRKFERENAPGPGLYVPINDRSPNRAEWLSKEEHARGAKDPTLGVLSALTQHHSTFTRQDIAQLVSMMTSDARSFSALMDRVEGSPELARLPGTDRLTTQTMIRAESILAATVDAMAQDQSHPINAKGLRLRARVDSLSPEQFAALKHITSSQAISCVTGHAGTGKSTMLRFAREVWEASGYQVRGAALAGIAAQGLQDGTGITSSSLAALQWGLNHQTITFTPHDILVIDEAGMVGSRQTQQVMSAARLAGAKVVLVGDAEQLQSIEAGAAYRAVTDRVGAARLETIRRQTHAWQRDATTALATAETAQAINAYARHGHLRAGTTRIEASKILIADWSEGLKSRTGLPDLILAPTRRDVALLNASAREAMERRNRLGTSRRISAVEEAVGKRPRSFDLHVAVGERLLFTKNDRRLGVRNGTLGTLEAFGANCLVIRLDNRERVVVDLSQYQNLAHGYAMTIHKAQGVTVDRAHVLAGRSMDRHMAYVALSRHRDAVNIYYGRDQFAHQTALANSLSRQRKKDTTLDYPLPGKLMNIGAEKLPQPGKTVPLLEKRSDRIRLQALDWKKRSPDRDFGLEL